MAGHNQVNSNHSNPSKLSRLQDELPPGLLAPAAWLDAQGYYRQLLAHYVSSGWLESPARGVYRRPGTPLKWQHVVASLQGLLKLPVHVGGLTALEVQGYGHFVRMSGVMTVHLYAPARLPSWLHKLPLQDRFIQHRCALFGATDQEAPSSIPHAAEARAGYDAPGAGLRAMAWGDHDWPLRYSTPERAILELLEEVPQHESVGHANLIMQGLRTLSPDRLKQLLLKCRSIKVKRLFFALAEHNNPPWLKHLDAGEFDLGRGNRVIVRGGKLHPKYRITLPENIDDSV